MAISFNTDCHLRNGISTASKARLKCLASTDSRMLLQGLPELDYR